MDLPATWGETVNAKRIAALLRELADAFEAPEPKRKRAKNIAAPETAPTQEAQDKARRALRKAGFAA